MTPDEIKAKSSELAALYTAKANGKTLQVEYSDGWRDYVEHVGPSMGSDLSRWRVKPEPRRMWEVTNTMSRTDLPDVAKKWKACGYPVTEWMEVLP
jgi:hypothetical protein